MRGGPTEREASTLRSRLGRSLVVVGVVLLVVLSVSAVALARVLTLQDQVTGPYFDAVTQGENAYVDLLDAEIAVRSFAATGDDVALEAFERAVGPSGSVELAEADVLSALQLERDLALSLDHAATATREWLQEVARPAIEATREQGPGSVGPRELSRGAEAFADARSGTAEYIAGVRAERLERVDALDRWSRVLFGSVLVLVVSALAAGVALWVCLRRWVTEPVAQLAHRVRQVSSGTLHEPVVTSGPAELAGLARDVEHMRVALVDQVREIRATHEEVARSHDLLAEQAHELERSNRDLEQFAYVASHDLQEPLRKVASFTQLLQKRYGGQLDERADQYIDFAVDGAKRMQRLIQDLLGFSRVGRTGAERVDVDLDATLRTVVDDLSERITETGAEVTHDPLPVVLGEPALLHQLLINLVGNALKFRDPSRAPRIHVGVRSYDTHWELSCTDNGIGIDAQYAERVFVIFQRLHAKEVYEGTGIGLALCKRIVEYHGGRIWIEPRDVGTTIRFTLAHAYVQAQVGYARPVDRGGARATPALGTDREESTA